MRKLSLIIAALLATQPIGALSQEGGLTIRCLSHTDKTDVNLERLRKGIATIPITVQREIANHGISVVLSPRMVFDEPENSGHTIFRNGGTLENIGGEFEPGKNRVIIPEEASWQNSPPRPQGNYVIRVVRHELGHAWDHALGQVTTSEPYKEAYDEDFKRLTNEQCRSFAYFITGVASGDANVPTASGRRELFAGLFDVLTTPVESRHNKDNLLLAAFPHTTAFMQNLDRALSTPPSSEPKPERAPSRTSVERASSAVNEFAQSQSDKFVQAGLTFWQQQQPEASIQCFEDAIKLDATNTRALQLCGDAYASRKNFREAVKNYSAYLKLKPNDAKVYKSRANAYGWLGEKRLQDADNNMASSKQ
jgi:hypothetical protein